MVCLVFRLLIFSFASLAQARSIDQGVTCPELNWPAFPAFQNIPAETQCWEEVRPSFRLYVRPGDGEVIQDTNNPGLMLQRRPGVSIKHLVVITHGLISTAKVGKGEKYWVHEMANLILEKDKVFDHHH